MVHEAYDNIVAIILVGIIFIGAVLIMPKVSFSNIQVVDYLQLKNTAVNVFDALLLDPGEPLNWGSNQLWSAESVNRFGLADSTHSGFYVLDPDKVQRLKIGNPLGEITNDEVKELLGLDGYGFNLRIIPPFNVTNTNGKKIDGNNSPINAALLNQGNCSYELKVSFLDGRPIPNADVKTLMMYTDGSEVIVNNTDSIKTNSLGICSNSIPLKFVPSQLIVILYIDVADVATLVVSFGKNAVDIVDINMVGDTLVLTKPKGTPNSAVQIQNISIYGDTLLHLYEGEKGKDKFNTGNSDYKSLWNKTFPDLKSFEPTLVLINVKTVPPGNGDFENNGVQELVVAGPYQNLLGYSVFEYGDPPKISDVAIRLQRSVVISGMTYTAELVFWKEV
jgi:hypothetical protein